MITKSNTLFTLAIALLAAIGAWASAPMISLTELRLLQLTKSTEYILIDVRLPADFKKGHIQGAKNVPSSVVSSWQPPEGVRIVIYCPSNACPTGENSAQILIERSIPDVLVLDGGFAAWSAKGFPIVRTKTAPAPRPKPKRLGVKEAGTKISAGELLVIDLRPKAEYEVGWIEGARNVPVEKLSLELAYLSKDKPVLIYDRVASRTLKGAGILLNAGYEVYVIPGGLAGWLAKGMVLEVK